MPLVKRVITPRYLSRRPESWGVTETGEEVTFQGEYDLTGVTNVTLCGALQQLASILVVAQEIYDDLEEQLVEVCHRSQGLTTRLHSLEERIQAHNPRTVSVPESDLRSFSERKEHFEIRKIFSEMLFTFESRPNEVQRLYEESAQTPLHAIREIDQFRNDGFRSSMYFTCKPVFGDTLKKEKLLNLLEIETRRPASFVALRDWGSDDETLQSEVELAPISPAAPLRPPPGPHPPNLKLPLPEERQIALSCKYPPQLVPIDVSGRGFRRMELFRQSLVQFDYVKNRKRRRRLRRRNTIADTREVRAALNSDPSNLPSTSSGQGRSYTRSISPSSRGGLSSYTDRSFDTSSSKTNSEREVGHRSHVLGLDVCVPTPPRNVCTLSRNLKKGDNTFRVDSMNHHDGGILNSLAHSSPREPRKYFLFKNGCNINGEEAVSISGGEGESAPPDKNSPKNSQGVAKLPISSSSSAINMAVKLRENNSRDEGTRSSSGNWSGSSSTRTSLESDIQHQHLHLQVQKSHNNISNSTQEEELEIEKEETEEDDSTLKKERSKENGNQHFDQQNSPSSSIDQESFFSESYPETTSRTTEDLPSSSHTSDGTLTPTQDIGDIPFVDDDTGSAFSCDAEGYYTSFHIDSGLRSISYEGNKLATDSDVEVFGRGSTGTTNSSASLGTVIMRNPEKKTPPKPPQRVSSLERKENRESVITVIHVNGSASSSREDVAGAESSEKEGRCSKESDSGRETAETMSPKNVAFSPEPSEQQLESISERKENLRAKTAINASGIPSMCVITPPQSDDESVRSGSFHSPREGPQGESRVQRKVAAFQANSNNNNKVTNFTAVRQPGDGAVAPAVPSSSPSFTLQNSSQSYTPTLTVMSQHRSGELSAQLKVFPPSQEQPPVQKSQTDYLSLGRSVSERRAEIQLKVLGERKPSSDVLIQKQISKESLPVGNSDSLDLVSYKELPTTVTSSHPFSAIPSNVKQDVVITPTNSLERRKANSKLGGAHVTLDSEGKVVYSSDSLPRRKGHTSFEPGPYIKPPPITATSSNGTQSKIRLSGVSSIQSMPLPPVPGQQTSHPYSTSTPHSTVTATRTTSKSLESTVSSSSVTPQQPKLGTRTQVNAISQTLSGLSSHMQPRTISQINSIRSAQVKSPKTVLQEPVKSIRDEEGSKFEESKFENFSQSQQSYQTRLQTQGKENNDQISETVTAIPSILKKTSSIGKEEAGKHEGSQDLDILGHQKLTVQQAIHQPTQYQGQSQIQSLVQQPAHQSLHQAQQKLQQQQEQHQLLLQQQLHLQQQQQKQHILQQQHMELQRQLEQQQQQLQQHKAQQQQLRGGQARQTEQQVQAKKDTPLSSAGIENIYQTRQEMQRQQLAQLQQQHQLSVYQQAIYQSQDEAFALKQQQLQVQQQQQQQLLQQHQQQRVQNGSQVATSDVILASQGAPMSPPSQRGAYTPIPSKILQSNQDQVDSSSYNSRGTSSQNYHVSTTSRAPTPVQGLSTSSPQRLPTNTPTTLQHQGLRTHPAILYGSQRSLQNLSLGSEGRATPIPRPISTSPPPYDHYNVTNSDIYGRIGMTRQVQVGGTLPAGFGRNQRTYSSLPPNLRQPLPTAADIIVQQGRLRQQAGSKALTRRASVAGTETSNIAKSAASNPSTPEKALDKKEKGSKREKDKDKDKDKKKKETKTEKSPKKKWFWTLPLRRKKKSKDDQNNEDDDGGFKDVSVKAVRKVVPAEDTSFIRYPSPDTGSSDLNSSYSSDVSSGEHGYRSSPSSEVYYYSQRAQLVQQQQQQQALSMSIPPVLGSTSNINAGSNTSMTVAGIPRSHPTTPVSPSEAPILLPSESTDLTDLTRNRRYMSRDEMYAAMRHPQYYNMNRNSIPGMSGDYSQNSTPNSSRSSSPAIFGINPPPPYAIRPQVRDSYQLSSEKVHTSSTGTGMAESQHSHSDSSFNIVNNNNAACNNDEDGTTGNEIEPPAAYRESISTSPTDSQESDSSTTSTSQNSNRVIAKQTTLVDFKKMILEKSMNSAGGRERISAVEMLRASRPSIYGYSPPPAPVIVKSSQEPVLTVKGEGIIMPPNSRNTARALLFQSRFGSGRRFRSPKTEIISTTIVEDKMEEEAEKTYDEDSDDSDEEDLSSSTTSSQERRSVQSVRGPLAKSFSENVIKKTIISSSSNSNGNGKEVSFLSSKSAQNQKTDESKVAHSTPIKLHHVPPQAPDVSVILPQSEEDQKNSHSREMPNSPEKESIETSL